MTYFLLQHRYLHSMNEAQPSFPTALVARIKFGPEDAFGVPGTLPRTTAKRATPARLLWNANEATSTWEGPLIDALNAELRHGKLSANWSGNELAIAVEVNSQDEAHQLIGSANQLLPAFLSLRLRVFVWIKEFVVEIGTCRIRLETSRHRYGITIATAERNQQEATQAIHDWLGQRRDSLRLVMAAYYFRHAMRLAVLEPDRQSMAAEVILNLAKAIEIIFSSDRKQLRAKAKEWGFDSAFIEHKVVPILLIRSELDVAHVTSAPLSSTHIHTLISRLVEMSQAGHLVFDPVSESMDKDKDRLLRRIAEYAASE
jgi:hypothetical protein